MHTSNTTIADRVLTLQQQSQGRFPEEVRSAFGAEVTDLAAAGIPAAIATVGTVMPDGELVEATGGPTTLAAIRAGRAAIVVFYRGAWCPYCNIALRAYQEQLVDELQIRNTVLVALSPQKPDGSLTVQEKNDLTYAVISDPGNQIAGQLGILTAPSDDARSAQASLGLDLVDVNADGHRTLPFPTVVVVDAAGTIRWIDVHPDYTTRSESAHILAALDDALDRT